MTTLVLNDVDDALVERLERLAAINNRSVDEQAVVILREGVPRLARADRTAIAASIAAMTPAEVPQTDTVILLRQDRARDDDP